MKKFLKKMFKIAFIALLGYTVVKIYKKIKAVDNLGHSLPLFLKNVMGEKPQVSINCILKHLTVKIGYPEAIIQKEENIEDTIVEYIRDFYPELASSKITVNVYSTDSEECSQEQECCCSEPQEESEVAPNEEACETKPEQEAPAEEKSQESTEENTKPEEA